MYQCVMFAGLCEGVLQPHKWENCLTLDRSSWGYRRNMRVSDVLTMDELTTIFAQTIRSKLIAYALTWANT